MSVELTARLNVYPKMKAALDLLPPKVLALASDKEPVAVELQAVDLDKRVAQVIDGIERAAFTGNGDKPMVIDMYKTYVGGIADTLQKTLALASISTEVALPPMPSDSSYKAMRDWHLRWMHAQHETIADALSGKRLDVRTQCVPIAITGTDPSGELLAVRDAAALSEWLPTLREGGTGALLTAGPASGKTWLLSQVPHLPRILIVCGPIHTK